VILQGRLGKPALKYRVFLLPDQKVATSLGAQACKALVFNVWSFGRKRAHNPTG
jgi:hypothetical protein